MTMDIDIFVVTVAWCVCSSSDDMVHLHDALFTNYKNNVRPVRNQQHAVHVNISFNIIMIHDLVRLKAIFGKPHDDGLCFDLFANCTWLLCFKNGGINCTLYMAEL